MREISDSIVTTNNEWLIWARKSANYAKEEIAAKMDVDPDVIEEWENTGNIKYDHLVEIANYYKRPPTMFFNVNKPVDTKPIPDLRTKESKRTRKATPEMSFEFREAEIKRQHLIELEEEMEDFEIPYFTFKNVKTHDTNEIAEKVSHEIGMNTFKRTNKKLEYWIEQVEQLGVLVFQFYDIEPKYMRGYAIYYDKLPIIGINNKEHENGQKFTLFHELAHLILKREGFSDINNYFLPNDEKKCNEIAAEILVPKLHLNEKMNLLQHKKDLDVIISSLSKDFKVSNEVIVRRLLDNGYLTHQYYLNKKDWDDYIGQKKRKYSKKRKKEKDGTEPETTKNGENSSINVTNSDGKKGKNNEEKNEERVRMKYRRKATEALRKNGKFYTKSVLEAYDEKAIQIDDVLKYLDVPLEVFYAINQKMMERDHE